MASLAFTRGRCTAGFTAGGSTLQVWSAQSGVDLKGIEIFHEPDQNRAARKACELVSKGDCHIVMKGKIHTDDFLRAILDKEVGLRGSRLLSYVFILEVERPVRHLVFVTDGACMTSMSTQNPSLTFMALTARAANHAVEELKKAG